MLALRPTLGDYVLKMPRGAQRCLCSQRPRPHAGMRRMLPGARLFEAGTGSGALTMALLRAVGLKGMVVTYEKREDFARTARTNIDKYMGRPISSRLNRTCTRESTYWMTSHSIESSWTFREPWQVVPHAAKALRSGRRDLLSSCPRCPKSLRRWKRLSGPQSSASFIP